MPNRPGRVIATASAATRRTTIALFIRVSGEQEPGRARSRVACPGCGLLICLLDRLGHNAGRIVWPALRWRARAAPPFGVVILSFGLPLDPAPEWMFWRGECERLQVAPSRVDGGYQRLCGKLGERVSDVVGHPDVGTVGGDGIGEAELIL